MSAGDASSIDSIKRTDYDGISGWPIRTGFAVSPTLELATKVDDTQTFSTKTAQGPAEAASSTAWTPHGRSAAAPDLAKPAWLWRSTHLTTIAAGCGMALALHTLDSYFLSASMPPVLAGLAPHLVPPLCALLVSAILAVIYQRTGREGLDVDETVAERFMLLTTTFALAWTSIECLLRIIGLAADTRRVLPVETLFTAVVVLFYGLTWGRSSQRLPWDDDTRDVLIVGTDAVARDVKEYLQRLPRSKYRFRGFLTTAEQRDWSFAGQDEVAGHVDDLASAARSMFVDEVIVAATSSMRKSEEMCEQARRHEITLRFVPSVSEGLRRAHEVRYIGGLPTLVAYEKRRRPISQIMKRATDLVLGLIALVVLSPVFLMIAMAIKLQSDGPVFYRSERVGLRGRGFLCYKFRTMVRDADALRHAVAHLNERKGILFKISNDPRVTPLGALLRKYSLDELPQLFNVLRGEMSLVGPRPSLRAEVLQYGTAHFRRLDVVPGMTGLWQVEARTDPSFESYVALDCRYADEWSMGLDLRILLKTLRVVFLGTGV